MKCVGYRYASGQKWLIRPGDVIHIQAAVDGIVVYNDDEPFDELDVLGKRGLRPAASSKRL